MFEVFLDRCVSVFLRGAGDFVRHKSKLPREKGDVLHEGVGIHVT